MTEYNENYETDDKKPGLYFHISDGQVAPTRIVPSPRAKRHRRVLAVAAVLAVLSAGIGGYALHQHGVAEGREQASAPVPETAPSPDPTITGTDTICGGRYVVTAGGKGYLLVVSGFGG